MLAEKPEVSQCQLSDKQTYYPETPRMSLGLTALSQQDGPLSRSA